MTSFTTFMDILGIRLAQKRSETKEPLSIYTHGLILGAENNIEYDKLLQENIPFLLAECEVTHNMPLNKALDALQELSHIATYFAKDFTNINYNKACLLINKIRATYPPEDNCFQIAEEI